VDESGLPPFPVAEQWSLLAGQLGKGFVFAGIVGFVLCILLWAFQPKRASLGKWGTAAFALGSLSLFGAMACLIALFVRDQFQYQYVFARADSNTSLQFKIAGVWAGQQGSFLLWATASTIFGMIAMRGTGHYRRWYTMVFALFLGSVCGILAYETPFNLMSEVVQRGKVFVPDRGNGLTPSLQNYWVVIHPPTIFLGFGALTVMFAYAVAAMMTGDLEDWVRRVRGWTHVALAILGLGICMGGFWAYETLGWGGFWAWDPVENVSFVPWLVTAAFVHGMIVQTTRKRWHGANLVMAGLPFLLFVYGTFLTRSGFLSEVSVHSFAQMDESALKVLLGFLGASTVAFFGLYLWKGRAAAARYSTGEEPTGVQRESFYRWGTIVLSLAAVIIAVGMSWPLLMSLSGRTVAVVEERLYHKVLVWGFVPLMLLMGSAPFVSWRSMGWKELLSRLSGVAAVTMGLLGVATFAFRNPTWGVHARPDATVTFPFDFQAPLLPWMVFLTGLMLFVVVANAWRIAEMVRRSPMSIGGFLSHLGFATLLAGLVISRGFQQKQDVFVRPDRPEQALDYSIRYMGRTTEDPYDRNGKVLFGVSNPDLQFTAQPGLYYYRDTEGQDKPMVWPHIQREFSHDIYMAMGEPQIFVWEEPIFFKAGETKTERSITVKVVRLTREGTQGMAGAKFGALVEVTVDGQTFTANPVFELGKGPDIVRLNDDFAITMPMMRAEDGSVGLQMLFATPIFPVTLFYKPMTILVWIGTGILFVGGLIAAIYRRARPRKPSDLGLSDESAPTPADAPLATSQS
jgi:cytochrome c-type biogenesis protein CcmF